jgi:hypothetical protein
MFGPFNGETVNFSSRDREMKSAAEQILQSLPRFLPGRERENRGREFQRAFEARDAFCQ